jgi:hypothetical protein
VRREDRQCGVIFLSKYVVLNFLKICPKNMFVDAWTGGAPSGGLKTVEFFSFKKMF